MKKTPIYILLIMSLFGCASGSFKPSPPNTLNYKLTNTSSLTPEETILIVNKALKIQVPSKYTVSNNCISQRGANTLYKHCFNIENEHLISTDNTTGGNAGDPYGMFNVDHGFGEFINNSNIKIGELVQDEIGKYNTYKTRYNTLNQQFNKKISTVKVSLLDTNNVLINKYKAIIIDNIKLENKTPNAEFLYRNNKDIEKNLMLEITLPSNIQRFNLSKTNKWLYNSEFESEIKLDIPTIRYNYTPELFVMKDNNISYSINNYGQIKIANNTRHFIQINNISEYYGDKILDFINEKGSFKIPPQSTINLRKNFDFTPPKSSKYIEVKSKNESVKYGASIEYHIPSLGKTKTLYEINNYRISDFIK